VLSGDLEALALGPKVHETMHMLDSDDELNFIDPACNGWAPEDPPAQIDTVETSKTATEMWAQYVEQHIRLGNTTTECPSTSMLSIEEEEYGGSQNCDPTCIGMQTTENVLDAGRASEYGDKILLLKLTRCNRELQKALHEGRELECLRAEATSQGKTCFLRSGASIFVYPEEYDRIISALRGTELRAHHILVFEAFLPLVFEAIGRLP